MILTTFKSTYKILQICGSLLMTTLHLGYNILKRNVEFCACKGARFEKKKNLTHELSGKNIKIV